MVGEDKGTFCPNTGFVILSGLRVLASFFFPKFVRVGRIWPGIAAGVAGKSKMQVLADGCVDDSMSGLRTWLHNEIEFLSRNLAFV